MFCLLGARTGSPGSGLSPVEEDRAFPTGTLRFSDFAHFTIHLFLPKVLVSCIRAWLSYNNLVKSSSRRVSSGLASRRGTATISGPLDSDVCFE